MKAEILAFLVVWSCFFFCFPVYAAEESVAESVISEQEVSCGTKEELLAFLKADAGGTAVITGDILWDYTYNNLPVITKPVSVRMGTYKISIPAGCRLQIQGPVSFVGEGVVLFESEGVLNFSYGVEVQSTGENAVAIQCLGDFGPELFICNISAVGANSTAIQAMRPVTVQLCHIVGTYAAIEAPEVTLDASVALPMPTGAIVIERVPMLDRSLRLYGITVFSDVSEEQYKKAIYGFGYMQYAFIDPQTGNAIGGPLTAVWSGVPEWPVEVGSYTLNVTPYDLPDWFPVEIPSFDIPLHIIEQDTLWLNVGYSDPVFGVLSLVFVRNIPDTTAQITLYYSTDEGKTWRNAKEDFPELVVRNTFIDIVGLEQNTNYWFYAEVSESAVVGSSNTVYYANVISDIEVDFSHGGGDRDEGDFGDQGEQPPSGEIILPPAEDMEADDMPDSGEKDTSEVPDSGENDASEVPDNGEEGTPSNPDGENGGTEDSASEPGSDFDANTTSEPEAEPPSDSTDRGVEDTPGTPNSGAEGKQNVQGNGENDTLDAPGLSDDSEAGIAEGAVIPEKEVVQTEVSSAQETDKADLQPQEQTAFHQIVDKVLPVLAFVVIVGTVWLLILRRKGVHP